MGFLSRTKPKAHTASISEKECFNRAVSALDNIIEIPIRGKLYQRKIIEAVVGMASNQDSIHSIAKSLKNIPCETSLRHHLKKLDFDFLLENNTDILLSDAILLLNRKKSYRFAIDFTHDPYYGKTTSENSDYIIRSQAKKSTNEFYGYATLYVINKYRRLTLSIIPIQPNVSPIHYVRYFLEVIESLNLKTEIICLDRGFYSKEIIKFLQRMNIPHIIPVRRHGKELNSLLSGRGSKFETYTLKDNIEPVTFDLVVYTTYLKGKRGKHKAVNYGYVVYGVNWSPEKVAAIYRTRFAIEASYRMRNKSKPKTSTKCVKTRYFYAIVSMLLKNIWLTLAWDYFCPIQPGPSILDVRDFSFERFLNLLWNYLKKKRKFITKIQSHRAPIQKNVPEI